MGDEARITIAFSGFMLLVTVLDAMVGFIEAGLRGAVLGAALVIIAQLLSLLGLLPVAGVILYTRVWGRVGEWARSHVPGADLTVSVAYYYGLFVSVFATFLALLLLAGLFLSRD